MVACDRCTLADPQDSGQRKREPTLERGPRHSESNLLKRAPSCADKPVEVSHYEHCRYQSLRPRSSGRSAEGVHSCTGPISSCIG